MRTCALLCLLAPPTMSWQHLKAIKDPNTYEALLYEPQGSGPWPLLLYLHGAGATAAQAAKTPVVAACNAPDPPML